MYPTCYSPPNFQTTKYTEIRMNIQPYSYEPKRKKTGLQPNLPDPVDDAPPILQVSQWYVTLNSIE